MTDKAAATQTIRYRVARGISGLGLVAVVPIAEDGYIIEYTGTVLKLADVPDKPNMYLMEVGRNKYIDGSIRTNTARYVNHSCNPNAYLIIERGHAWIRALRDIAAGEEITFDYGEDFFNTYIQPKGCRCAQCSAKNSP